MVVRAGVHFYFAHNVRADEGGKYHGGGCQPIVASKVFYAVKGPGEGYANQVDTTVGKAA